MNLRFFLMLILSFCSIQIVSAEQLKKLISESAQYASALFKEHPELKGDKEDKVAMQDLLNEMAKKGVMFATEEQKNKISTQAQIYTDAQYQKLLADFSKITNQGQHQKFLEKYAQKEQLDYYQKIIAYRMMESFHTQGLKKHQDDRMQRVTEIAQAYQQYFKINSKPPESLKDLKLPENSQFFYNVDGQKKEWIYIGNLAGFIIKAKDSKVILTEPEPTDGRRFCALENGEVLLVTNDSIEKSINQLNENIKIQKEKGVDITALSPELIKTQKQMLEIMKKYTAYKNENGDHPNSLAKLKLSQEDKKYYVAELRRSLNWIFLGSKSHLKNSDSKLIVLVCPVGIDGKRPVGIEDGSVAFVADEEIEKSLKRKK